MHGRKAAVSIAVPFVRLLRRLTAHGDGNFPVLRDVNPHVLHTGRPDGTYRSGDVGLPECGGRAGHGITVAKSAYRSLQIVQAVADRAEHGRTGDLGRADQAIGEGTGVEGRYPRALVLLRPVLRVGNTRNAGKVSFRLLPATVDVAFWLFW